MKSPIGRRAFVGGVVAGLPVLAASGAGAFAQGAGTAHVHGLGVLPDPVLEHLARQLAAIHNRARTRGMRGEDARAFAATLRTMSVYGKQLDLDGQVRTALSEHLAANGRDSVLYQQGDRSATNAELQRFGFDIDSRLLARDVNHDYATRAAALDELMSGGASGAWERIAALLDRAAPELDRRAAQIRPVAAQDWNYWYGFCTSLQRDINSLELQAGWMCALAAIPYWGAIAGPSCVAIWGGIAALAVAYLGYCGGITY
jgi:hypothetical protein